MGVLSSPIRRSIITLLRDHEQTAGAIAESVGLSGPTISHHLYALLEAGVVTRRINGSRWIYTLCVPTVLEEWDRYVNECPECVAREEVP